MLWYRCRGDDLGPPDIEDVEGVCLRESGIRVLEDDFVTVGPAVKIGGHSRSDRHPHGDWNCGACRMLAPGNT